MYVSFYYALAWASADSSVGAGPEREVRNGWNDVIVSCLSEI
jgi:hypothetical protein